MKISKITKVAGAGLLGFCAVSLAADKVNLTPVVSQIAGFAGAFVGSLVAKMRTKKKRAATSPASFPGDSGEAERCSGIGLKLFGFIPESVFTFIPDHCSESSRIGVRHHLGIAFTFPRNPHIPNRSHDQQ